MYITELKCVQNILLLNMLSSISHLVFYKGYDFIISIELETVKNHPTQSLTFTVQLSSSGLHTSSYHPMKSVNHQIS